LATTFFIKYFPVEIPILLSLISPHSGLDPWSTIHEAFIRQEPQLTREEVEKRLESRQIVFGIEKAPMMLPMEIFSHDNSNQDR
jgi:hypothetical protein